MKKMYAVLLLSMALFFSGCPFGSDDKDDNPLIGKWYLYRMTEVEYVNGELEESYDQTYNPVWDNYFYAVIIEFTDKKMIMYDNVASNDDYYYDEESYEYKNGKLIVEGEEVPFEVKNGMLVTEWIEEDVWDGESYRYEETMYFKKYEGELPPASWLSPIAGDQYEADNSYQTSTQLTVGANFQQHTLTADDIDWFSFDAVEGKQYLIIVGSFIDTYVSLYGPDGTTYITYDDDNERDVAVDDFGYPLESVLYWSAAHSEKLYFNVQGYSASYKGYYIVSVKETNMNLGKAASADKKVRETKFRNPAIK